MDPLTLALITGLISFAGGLITNGVNSRNVRTTNEANRLMTENTNQTNVELAERQHAWNVEDWQRQADWQSPANQMSMFRSAGLNPNLIYGQMSDSPSINSTQMPTLSAPKYMPFQSTNPVANSASDILSIAQARKFDVEADAIIQKLPQEVRNLEEQNKLLSTQVSELNKKIELYSSQIQNLYLEGQLKVAQEAKIYFDINLASATFSRDSDKVLAEINYLRSLSNEADSRTALNKRNLYELRESWSYRLLGFDLDNMKVASEIGLNRAKVVESNFVAQQIGLDIQAGRLHAAINQSLYDTSFGGKGSKIEQKINCALLAITDYFGKSAVSIGNGLQSAGALKMLLK